MPSAPQVLSGIGIDLIGLARVKKLLKTHAASKIARLLSPLEQKYFRSKRKSPLIFAKYFTAKEAFFKSLGKSWLGLEGFAQMEVRFLPAERFKIRLLEGTYEAEGVFFSFDNHVGAQVIRL